ncbi:MAG: HlyD family efflux transporter periplasmic adaptor subunit [Candidatus Viridilinea halotolerans]|uniref:HlyD family efflux transporter periplasmic adaptor subunit n=1 Tax=Candidatus Viridilinea halotolerans TaxID=2491704 RepID=A0A426U1I0_9CHLR|nr:MAG: HlyD family efflux transporter periplasmic adaptor subunit [Candidatus Viridilinea halotolerans]
MILALALTACASPSQEPPAAAVNVPTMELPTSAPLGGGGAAAAPADPDAAADTPGSPAPLVGGSVTASGEVQARRDAALSFRVPGTIAEVLVEEGQTVRTGDPLVRLDLAELNLSVRQAEAGLAQAQAGYERLAEGARPEDIAAASAQVAQAQGALRQARGSVTAEDIAAAEAALASAIARQAEIAAGPKTPDMQQAEAAVAQAHANLEMQRTNLSAAKNNAQLQLEIAANNLRDAQQTYSRIYWDNIELRRELDKYDRDMPQEALDAEDQALRRVNSAEVQIEQATLALEQAANNESDGIRAAEANVRTAEASLQRLLDGATAEQRAAADAQVAQARANLDRLRGEQRAGSVQSAQAAVSAAQANLARANAGATTAELAQAQAQVEAATAQLEAARLNLSKGTITAPFAGTIARLNVEIGDIAGTSPLPAVQIVDTSELRIEVNISDTDVARVRIGQSARINVDGLPGLTFSGSVTFIAPTASVVGNIRTFPVRITIDQQDQLRAGMSARVAIQAE